MNAELQQELLWTLTLINMLVLFYIITILGEWIVEFLTTLHGIIFGNRAKKEEPQNEGPL